uniref:DDE-1 domain-containing protein n=1 Tax=Phlebotomus papatasi TaxID=29031 RepID=A0A1B0DMQ7_PHLPP
MDESAFNLAPTGELVLAPAGRHVYVESRNSDKENITTLFSVNASGTFAPPLTLYKYARLPAAAALSAPSFWALGKTDSGWMTSVSFYEYIANVFLPYLDEQQIEKPIIVFLDGHRSHLTLQLSKLCRDNGIILVALYPNSTHILQPLDVAVFKPIKSRWKALKRQWRIDHNGEEVTKFNLPSILNMVIQENQMSSNVISGFRGTGLFPFNEDAVDYRKIIKRTSQSTLQQPENTDEVSENQNLPLTDFENKIDPQKLEDFRAAMIEGGPWTGDKEDTSLFYFWRDMVFETYHPQLPPFFNVTCDAPDASVTEDRYND